MVLQILFFYLYISLSLSLFFFFLMQELFLFSLTKEKKTLALLVGMIYLCESERYYTGYMLFEILSFFLSLPIFLSTPQKKKEKLVEERSKRTFNTSIKVVERKCFGK